MKQQCEKYSEAVIEFETTRNGIPRNAACRHYTNGRCYFREPTFQLWPNSKPMRDLCIHPYVTIQIKDAV